ncbi:MAG: metal ABC transporter ATP-binding protein [Syntrophorhabdales bacterium]
MKTNMDGPLITFHDLSIGYNGRPVLSGITLELPRASFTAILGANGSGKSTLLKTLLGLLPPIEGRIDAPSVVFGYVPQSIQFDPIYLLSGFEVALMGVYGRVRPGKRVALSERAFARECLEAADAGEFARKPFAQLSGGQKQRVLIARALATRPNVLVLDEPTAGVDITATHAVLDFISQIIKEREITVLFVTHDFTLVRDHAQHVVWLHQGRVLQGTVEEIFTPELIFEMGMD